jgi:glutathione gamma-glutamylcysteinyltransferase
MSGLAFAPFFGSPYIHLQENVLHQVRDTKLFKMVHDQQLANRSCYNCSSISEEDSLTRIAAAVCCQGAAMLSGNLASRDVFCCRETCLKHVQANGDGLKTVISGSVVSQGSEQGVDMLLPMSRPCTSSCNSNLSSEIIKYPSSADVLTVLLLALHPSTWLNIKDERMKAEFQTLVSTDNLPDDLKREVCLCCSLKKCVPYKEDAQYILFLLKIYVDLTSKRFIAFSLLTVCYHRLTHAKVV